MSPPPAPPADPRAAARLAATLVADMAQGDPAALSHLIGLQGRGLTQFCARALDRPADAEDAVQEVFLKAWAAAGRYEPAQAAVSTWLYGIALNQCRDMNRRARTRAFFGLTSAPDPADEAPDSLRDLAGRQDAARVRAAIGALPDRQRQALLLKVVAELDNSAIAATMGCGLGAVEQLLVRARTALRARVDLDPDLG